jgi:hypothetical protein
VKLPDDAARRGALRVLNSRAGRDLARWVLGSLREGQTLDAAHLARVLVQAGEAEPVARLAATVLIQRATAASDEHGGTFERTERAQGIDPVALGILGRLKRRERAGRA